MRFKDFNLEVVNVERYSSDYSMTDDSKHY